MKKLFILSLLLLISFCSSGGSSSSSEEVAPVEQPEQTVDTVPEPNIDIWEAAKNGDIQAIKQHILFGTDLSSKHSNRDNTPLIIAACNGQYDAVRTLLDAGGVDSQDWAEILFRMYKRWAERKKFNIELIDFSPGDEAGIKSVILRIEGENAYGLLQSEKGSHRLVRISPFDTGKRRHTSFSLVEIMPEIEKEEQLKIDSKDLRIDVFKAGGAGGQSVQKNSTAVRIFVDWRWEKIGRAHV